MTDTNSGSAIAVDSQYVAEPVQADQGSKYARGRSRLAHSRWLITINTNQVFYGTEDNFQSEYDRIRGVIDKLFVTELGHNAPRFFPIKRSGAFYDRTKEHRYTNQYIKGIRSRIAGEIGTQKNCLHFHIVVEIQHYTYLNIAVATIRNDLVKEYGKNLFVNVKALRGNSRDIAEQYIQKTLYNEDPRAGDTSKA